MAVKYVLGNHIEAVDTVNWNAGQGFSPIGTLVGDKIKGKFDGLNHTIFEIYISNRPTQSYMAYLVIAMGQIFKMSG